MDMRIGGASQVWAGHVHSGSHWKQGMQGFAAFKTALQAGDLEAAKSAFANLHVPKFEHAKSPLARIGRALQGDDLAAAQSMLQAMLDARMGKAQKCAPVAQPPQPEGSVNLLA